LRTSDDHQRVVRNGSMPARQIVTAWERWKCSNRECEIAAAEQRKFV
jgi:hypothetical protein